MRFIVDAQLPPALAQWLGARGHHARHVAELNLLAASDANIAAFAESDGSALVTKDGDFVLLRSPDRFVLLWLRIGNATNRRLLAWIEPRWPATERMLDAGERFVELR